jgi:hypothetical protein
VADQSCDERPPHRYAESGAFRPVVAIFYLGGPAVRLVHTESGAFGAEVVRLSTLNRVPDYAESGADHLGLAR